MSTRELLAGATPRPWRVEERVLKLMVYGGVKEGVTRTVVCEIDTSWESDAAAAEAHADATLIAAAVNEYEALLDVVDAVAAADPLITVNGETKMPRECWQRIETAMLAAKRESPIVGVVAPKDDA